MDFNHMGDTMGDSWNHSDDEMSFYNLLCFRKICF